jgi:hypothetical protein
MNREAIDAWIERTILFLVVGILGFAVVALGAVRPFEYTIVSWLITAAFVLWAVRIWLAPQFRFLWPPICWAILPFVGYATWRAQTAELQFPAREELIQILFAAMLFLVVVNNLYGQESVRTFSFCLVFLAMIVAMYGLYQWLRPSNMVWGLERPVGYQGRASGTFYCPNHLAGFLEMIMPIGLAFTVARTITVPLWGLERGFKSWTRAWEGREPGGLTSQWPIAKNPAPHLGGYMRRRISSSSAMVSSLRPPSLEEPSSCCIFSFFSASSMR